MSRLSSNYSLYFVIGTCVYIAAHGLGLTSITFNFDDWIQIDEIPIEWANSGRWGLVIIHKYIFNNSFSYSFQAISCLALYLLIPFLLLHGKERATVPLIAVFMAGSTFPYWVDSMNFLSATLLYPLSLVLSVSAFLVAILPVIFNRGSKYISDSLFMVLSVIIGSVLFCLALSIYQTTGTFGVIVPLLFALRIININYSQLIRILIYSVLIGILGLILYYIGFNLYLHYFSEPDPVNQRLGVINLEVLKWKITNFTELIQRTAYKSDLHAQSFLYPMTQFVLLMSLIFIYFILILLLLVRREFINSIRIIIFVPAVVVLPTFSIWFAMQYTGYPPRAMAAFNFSLSAVLIVLAFQLKFYIESKYSLASKFILPTVASFLILTGITGSILASKLWFDQWRIYQRDLAMAKSIMSTYVMHQEKSDNPNPELILVGRKRYPNFNTLSSLSKSAFVNRVSIVASMNELYPLKHLKISFLPSSRALHSCKEFPGKGSVYRYNGDIFICLQDVK